MQQWHNPNKKNCPFGVNVTTGLKNI